MKQKWSTQILKEAQQKDLIVTHPHQEFEKQLKKRKTMSIELNLAKGSVAVWQTGNDETAPMASIIIEPTSGDMFFIRQDGVEIEVNHETVPELIKAIKAVIKL